MSRKPAIIPNRHWHTTVPKDLADRVDLLLFSDSEGRVPQGSLQSFLTRLVREFFSTRQLDLAPFLSSLPGEHVISGSDRTLSKLINHLKEVNRE